MKTDFLDQAYVKDQKTGLYHRPNCKELFLVKDKGRWHDKLATLLSKFGLISDKKAKLLNIGAHIGIWSKRALEMGFDVTAYEAVKSTAKLAAMNAPEAHTVWGAISTQDGTLEMYSNAASASVTESKTRGRTELVVPCYDINKILKKLKPLIVTMDCEGSEYQLIPYAVFPKETKALDLEIHITKKEWRESGTKTLTKILKSKGWKLKYIDKQRNHWAQGSLHSLWIR